MNRHCDELKTLKATALEPERHQGAGIEELEEFGRRLQQLKAAHNYTASMMDETMLELGRQALRVVVPRDVAKGYVCGKAVTMHITLGVTIFADGSHADTLVICINLPSCQPTSRIDHRETKRIPEVYMVWAGKWMDQRPNL